MKNTAISPTQLLADTYQTYHQQVFLYICYKIGDREEAKDLSQDVFLRLTEYRQLICPETVKSFIYTITRNLVADFLRHHYKTQEVNSYIYDCATTYADDVESRMIADDLLACEKSRLSLLPTKRRIIYALSRYKEKTILEISQELHLS